MTALADPPATPVSSFSKAKKIARNEIYVDHRETLYCACEFVASRTASGGKIGNLGCGYEPRKNETRGKRLEWEHIVPAWFFGHNRSCWSEGHDLCVSRNGKPYKGRRCCAKVDDEFKRIEADLHNLAPSVGELNGDRSNLPYGLVKDEPRIYGKCDFEIDWDTDEVEPAAGPGADTLNVRGDVARVWLYMSETYGIDLKPGAKTMFESWSAADAVDEWERTRNRRIDAVQGNTNPFVQP